MSKTITRITKTAKTMESMKKLLYLAENPLIRVAFLDYKDGLYIYGERKLTEEEYRAFTHEPQFTKDCVFIIDNIPYVKPQEQQPSVLPSPDSPFLGADDEISDEDQLDEIEAVEALYHDDLPEEMEGSFGIVAGC